MNSDRNTRAEGAGTRSSQAGVVKRWGGLVGGGALALYGLSRRSPAGLALAAAGGWLAYSNAKTHVNGRVPVTRSSVLLSTTPEEAYRFWQKFEDFPRFMHHLESVTDLGDGRSRWVAAGPLGTKIHWEAEIVSDRPNELIAWQSLPGSDVKVDGWVQFSKAPGNRGTLLEANIRYSQVKGLLPGVLASLAGKYPNFAIQQDLRRCKALIETDEIPTTEGQSHGPRSGVAKVAQMVDPDQPKRSAAPVTELHSALRRSS